MDISVDTLLRQVRRPARYAGAEWNSRSQDWKATRFRVALAHPNLYEVGISSPDMASLYSLLAAEPEILVERAYAPDADMAQALRAAGQPLFTVESHRALATFDLVLVELSRELAWTTLLELLDLGGVPLFQHDRDASDPLVVGWGAGSSNPEPLADFLDAALLGDAEAILPSLLSAWDGTGGRDRTAFLKRLAQIGGVYVPSLYTPRYNAAGRLQEVQPGGPDLSFPLVPSWPATLPVVPTRPPVPYVEAVQDRPILDVQRGCGPECPTYLAGLSTLPLRQLAVAEAEAALVELIRHTGYEEVAVRAGCLRDYQELEPLLRALAARCRQTQTALHVPALPLDGLTPAMVRALLASPRPSLSFAQEPLHGPHLQSLVEGPAGTRARETLKGAEDALQSVRLTLLLGHPTEQEDDWQAVVPVVQELRRLIGRKPRLRVVVTHFIPRPQTHLQRAPQVLPESLTPHIQALRKGISRAGATFSASDAEMAYTEGALARGDRRVGEVILAAWKGGATLQTWRERFDAVRWRDAFSRASLSPELFTREHSPEEVLPWSHLSPGFDAQAAPPSPPRS